MERGKRLEVPSRLADFDGSRRPGGHMWANQGGKPPKLRFRPGNIVRLEGKLWEVLYCFRLRETPTEWQYCLQERRDIGPRTDDEDGNVLIPTSVLVGLGAGATTPRVVYELFRNSIDAQMFFSDIVHNHTRVVTNKTMVQKAELVSSGEVIPPGHLAPR